MPPSCQLPEYRAPARPQIPGVIHGHVADFRKACEDAHDAAEGHIYSSEA
jgi:hypothetical protein